MSALCTCKLPIYGVTFVHVLTYLANLCTLSKMAGKEEDCAVLQYSGVPKKWESKALLVHNCSKRLRGIWSNFVGSEYCVVHPGITDLGLTNVCLSLHYAIPRGSLHLILNDQE